MKQLNLMLTLIVMMGVGNIASNAQQGVVAAGGETTGAGGTMSFSTGQTGFMHFSSETGSIQFGLQQVFFFDDDDIPFVRELTTDDLLQGEDQCFDAYETIILAGGGDTFIVEDGTGVDLIAGYSILMLQGTIVEYGGYMHARITSSDGPFCDFEEPIVASLQVDQTDNTTYEEPLSAPIEQQTDKVFFRVYPNPTTGDFTVEIIDHSMMGQAINIEIIGMRGELVKRINEISHFQHHLSLHGQQPGLYMIRVQCDDVFGIERIIKR